MANDYFGTLATLLNLLRQPLEGKWIAQNRDRILTEARDELMYLQKKYKIIKK